MNLNKNLSLNENINIDVSVSETKTHEGKITYRAVGVGQRFDPEKVINGGGPVVLKSVKIACEGKSYGDAQEVALNQLSFLLGLEGEQ